MPPIDPEKEHWDVIIVGTGMGGATLGYALARAGKRVLFCEQGIATCNEGVTKGGYAETVSYTTPLTKSERNKIWRLSGRCIEEIEDVSHSRRRRFTPFIGTATGGSSALYGMALERLFPSDFTPKINYQDDTTSTLPETWPITYEDLRPYYTEAEKLFRVRGTVDPIRDVKDSTSYLDPPPLSKGGDEFRQFLLGKGFHPYRLPLACDYVDDCECCQGYLCAKNCKNDSSKICLIPAIEKFGAQLLEECEVQKLEADHQRTTGILCQWRNRQMTLHASLIVLAAGALRSPAILLNSSTPLWPKGLANSSGLVGKNLMRHLIDLYVLTPKSTRHTTPMKELAFNDFYQVNGHKFGSVQTFGAIPPAQVITAPIERKIAECHLRIAAPALQWLRPIINTALTKFFSNKFIMASILEDLPYADNQVTISKSSETVKPKVRIEYHLKSYDKKRIRQFRKRIRTAFRPYGVSLVKQAGNNERIAHACGTCRFGSDPKSSVLDPFNRAHDLRNLYVVDASFFPSSGGINPALTIAANALRVADSIIDRI